MTTQTHYFIGIPVPQNEGDRLTAKTEGMRKLFKSWVHPLDYHLTLAFLGHPDSADQLQAVMKELHAALGQFPSFHLTISGFGTFGRKQAPRIFWAGAEKSEPLEKMRETVYSVCREHGFALDERPFAPHITIARKWAADEDFQERMLPDHPVSAFQVSKINLFQTRLGEVPKYHAIDTVLLR
ncbi:RNA 2',3'-cyclic phosphodiesterase [Metabacillus sp. SLBN-84]